ncbi:hypothetical protein TNCV_4057021 [Trichonephila clavipes]|nr:hypothetical protein TNCV_4057021 [Trichonephila clavipes]
MYPTRSHRALNQGIWEARGSKLGQSHPYAQSSNAKVPHLSRHKSRCASDEASCWQTKSLKLTQSSRTTIIGTYLSNIYRLQFAQLRKTAHISLS